MAVVQNLYQIFKIPASFIVANDCIVTNYTISRGQKEGNVVSIGDNLVFQQIRYYYNDHRSHKEIFNHITKLREHMHIYKKQGEYKKAHILNCLITKHLFVKDIINVCIDGKKSDFHKFRTKGFTFNGVHYSYFCSGTGQIRRNTATFIRSDMKNHITKILNCGLDEKTAEYPLAKYSAYFALSFSSILWVRTPRVCVINDFVHMIKDQKVDFVVRHPGVGAKDEADLEERIMDIELNCADGQGLIDPEFAKLWGKDMDLPFTPCSFVARSCFVKGNVVTFDFKDYAHQHGINTIKDRWGKEYNIDDIDVILSASQFKTHKFYSSWQDYLSYTEKGNIHWGVARYNKHRDDECVLANYQYIQALTLTKEDINELIQPTIDWINQICSGETLPTLLYLFGAKSDDAVFQSMYGAAQTNATKAVIKNVDFLQDSYVQHKIYKNITETINRAKIGKIWIRGNYQFMISDPVAQCQAALGLEPVGLLKANQVYSNWWNQRGVSGTIDLCRSPMIDQHEHNPCELLQGNEEADYWYRYINSGIIYNTYDTSCARHSDSDFDGDICLSTDNKFFLKGSNKDHNIITYDKGAAKPEKMTVSNITKTVLKGFGTGVGGFSNTATILYSMAAIFNKPEQQEQHDAIMRRIKLLREIVGQEIDRIKGADKPYLPSTWKHYEQLSPEDSDSERLEKFKRNAMVVSKKPYFFRYLYPELNQRFKQFEASYNQVSRDMFGIKFKKLLKKENKTEEEINLVRKYQKYSPLITSNCNMNILCRAIENVDFDIRFAKDANDHKKKTVSMLPTYENYFKDHFDLEKYAFVKKMYRSYNARRQVKQLATVFDNLPNGPTAEDFAELKSNVLNAIIEDLQLQLEASDITPEEFLFYCNRLAPTYSNFNWGFAWEILEDKIIQVIPFGQSFCPVHDEDGIEYLGSRYSLKDVSKKDEVAIQKMINSIFGDPEPDPEIEDMIQKVVVEAAPDSQASSSPTIHDISIEDIDKQLDKEEK